MIFFRQGRKDIVKDTDRLGNTAQYKMLLPEYQFQVDKVGSNTNGEKDNVLKEKNLRHHDNRPIRLHLPPTNTKRPLVSQMGEVNRCSSVSLSPVSLLEPYIYWV